MRTIHLYVLDREAARQFLLKRTARGAAGRNCEGELSAQGVIVANCRNNGPANAGGVGCHRPGVLAGI